MKKKGKFRVEMQRREGERDGRALSVVWQQGGMKRGGRTSTRGALLCDFRAKGANRRWENSAAPFSLDAPRGRIVFVYGYACYRKKTWLCARITRIEPNRLTDVNVAAPLIISISWKNNNQCHFRSKRAISAFSCFHTIAIKRVIDIWSGTVASRNGKCIIE